MDENWAISLGDLSLSLHTPGDGFYCGTRFDRSGVVGSLTLSGKELCDSWFERYDPWAHDAVLGPAEEFGPIGFETAAPGAAFLKIGVGLLRRPDAEPYDRFRLYEVTDGGQWTFERTTGDTVRFRHRMPGWYDYGKGVRILPGNSLILSHRLTAFRDIDTEVYNHNFFTLGRLGVGPGRELDFPFPPLGSWRSSYDSVACTASGIRFLRPLVPGESV